MKYRAALFIGILSLGGLLSCGLEEFYYIDYIQRSDYTLSDAAINLPSNSSDGYGSPNDYFDNFIIFYRIYISGAIVQTGNSLRDDSNARSTINAALDSDYNALYPYTDITSTSINTSNLEITFSNRRYFLLTLEGAEINNVLGSGSLGGRLRIFFDTNDGVQPTLTINGGTPYNLQRAVQNENLGLYGLNPLPNRRFLNHPDLYNNADFTNRINADAISGSGTPFYTYVSMYIAARGTSLEMPPRPIYSQPTFIGIFRLANS